MSYWRRRGVLVPPAAGPAWAVSHAALPVLVDAGGSRTELYVSARDSEGRARIGSIPVDWADGPRVGDMSPEPVLDLGELGAFDDNGVTSSCAVVQGGRTFLYYTGWTLGVTVPFFFFVGCAVREEGSSRFVRVSRAPILERADVDPYLSASPWVIADDRGWRMWYVSADRWERVGGKPRHWYRIKYAESDDGIQWRRDGRVCIDFEDHEYAISRPCVVRDGDRYRMWFASRGSAYRLAYAESDDGFEWRRMADPAGTPERGDGDAEMQAYPLVHTLGERRVLLYNGDEYGRTGVLWAEADAD